MVDIKDTKSLGKTLKVARVNKGITQKELSKLSGVSECTIVFLERGKHDKVQVMTLKKIADVLDINFENLF